MSCDGTVLGHSNTLGAQFYNHEETDVYHHLIQLSDGVLAKEIFNKQKEQSIGFVSEWELFLSDLHVEDNPSSFSKSRWSKLIKSRIHSKNRRDILTQVQSYKKLDYDTLVAENYGIQPYVRNMTVSLARTCFASRSMMLSSVQMNFKNKPEYKANKYRCVCKEEDHQAHLTSCMQYKHLQEGLDMRSDIDLVRFYQLVIREREKEKETDIQT